MIRGGVQGGRRCDEEGSVNRSKREKGSLTLVCFDELPFPTSDEDDFGLRFFEGLGRD
jgi:hypothetical protein